MKSFYFFVVSTPNLVVIACLSCIKTIIIMQERVNEYMCQVLLQDTE
jgi:hypothetical protein